MKRRALVTLTMGLLCLGSIAKAQHQRVEPPTAPPPLPYVEKELVLGPPVPPPPVKAKKLPVGIKKRKLSIEMPPPPPPVPQ